MRSVDSGGSDDEKAGGGLDLDDAVAKLEEKRALEAKDAPADEHFHWKVMGGKWTAEHLGVPYDAYRSLARSPLAKQFVLQYGINQSCSFTLAKFGEDLSKVLAEYWCGKIGHVIKMWCERGQGLYEFRKEDISSFVEPKAFSDAFVVAGPVQQKRLLELRGLQPSKPK